MQILLLILFLPLMTLMGCDRNNIGNAPVHVQTNGGSVTGNGGVEDGGSVVGNGEQSIDGGSVVGNGGDVIVCPDKVQMLDVYEAETLRGFRLSLGAPDLSVEEKIKIATHRLKKVDPLRALVIQIYAEKFFEEVKFVRGVTLRDIEDAYDSYVPVGCTREQIAIQNVKVINEDPFFIVSEDLWNRLDNDNKAALVIHEVIFRASAGEWSSSLVRVLASMAFSDYLDRDEEEAYFRIVTNTPLQATIAAGSAQNGKWYQQALYANDIGQFYSPITSTLEQLTAERDARWHYCGALGTPATEADLPFIYEVLQRFFWLTTHQKAYVWTLDHTTLKSKLFKLTVYRKAPTPIIEEVKVDGESVGAPWCMGGFQW